MLSFFAWSDDSSEGESGEEHCPAYPGAWGKDRLVLVPCPPSQQSQVVARARALHKPQQTPEVSAQGCTGGAGRHIPMAISA